VGVGSIGAAVLSDRPPDVLGEVLEPHDDALLLGGEAIEV
jgi:hypothetical protein